MLARVQSEALSGLDSHAVAVEAAVVAAAPAFTIVGLPDAAVQESRERVRTAIVNSRYEFPSRRITVNLAPADLPKEGSHYDLPIALCIMAAMGPSTIWNCSKPPPPTAIWCAASGSAARWRSH